MPPGGALRFHVVVALFWATEMRAFMRAKICRFAEQRPLQGDGDSEMLRQLRKHRNWMPRNKRKVAMAMPKMGRCQGFTLGLTTDYKCGGQGAPVVSKATRAHPQLAMALTKGCRNSWPDFRFTSIQVNLNTKYGMHTDGFDAGPSRMIALGNFSKGKLWLHNARQNRWSLINVQNTWIAFDGREFHLTEDWEGPERYSLVFFTNHLWDQLPIEAMRQLTNLGFAWPEEKDIFRQELEWPDRRQESALKSWRRSQWLWGLKSKLQAFQGGLSTALLDARGIPRALTKQKKASKRGKMRRVLVNCYQQSFREMLA
eukprot:symbB.v1.2.023657.t1/scaffold2181.1/size92752/1